MAARQTNSTDKEQEFPLLEREQDDGDISVLDYGKDISQRRYRLAFLRWSPWRYGLIAISTIIPLYFIYYVFGGFFGGTSTNNLPTALRPSFHFATPPETWLNDPNGLFQDSKGLWHMYYQHLPTWEAGNCKNWAHATSMDLYDWEMHPLAIVCEQYGIWSGSIVIDKNNTSGLFPEGHVDGVVAIYTQHSLDKNTEEQSIAYSLDGGYTFISYKKNPVLRLEPESFNFRDPKVRWHPETGKWVMVVAYAHAVQVAFYTSPNLIDWTFTSSFTTPALEAQHPTFECPGLEKIPYVKADDLDSLSSGSIPKASEMTWVLLLSNGGGSPFNGGSLTRYFPGEFNGTHFEPIDVQNDRIIDFGTDNYATQHFHNTPESSLPLSLAWAANIATCAALPSGPREHWRGAMSLPRYGALVKSKSGQIYYWSQPASIDSYRGEKLLTIKSSEAIDEAANFAKFPSGALILDAHVTKVLAKGPVSDIVGAKIHFLFKSSKSGEEVDCIMQFGSTAPGLVCDRSKAIGFETSDEFKVMTASPMPRLDESVQAWDIRIIFDKSLIEVYLGKGLQAGTMAFFPNEPLDTFVLKTEGLEGEVEIDAQLQELKKS